MTYNLDCQCRCCAEHGLVHPQTTVATLAGPAAIDDELVPLVTALTDAGVSTIASCVNLREAVDLLMPGEAVWLTIGELPPVNYRHTIRTRAVFVQYLLTTPRARDFHARIDVMLDVVTSVDPSSNLAQVSFPRDLLPALVAVTRKRPTRV